MPKKVLIIFFLLFTISSYSQNRKLISCEKKIDQLYTSQKLHLIFCSYYFEKVNSLSGADTIINDLTFYGDTTNVALIKKQDNAIIKNLKKGICSKDTSLVNEMKQWCEVSGKVAKIRAEVNFTLEGYMELLNAFKYTSPVLKPYFKNRTIYSLSTSEMEWLYFGSFSIIKSLKVKDRNNFFNKMKKWNF